MSWKSAAYAEQLELRLRQVETRGPSERADVEEKLVEEGFAWRST
jgi:hypothetical protein